MREREERVSRESLDAQAAELLDVLPEHPIDDLIATLPDATVSCLGYGSRSLVFRVQGLSFHPDMTVKIFLAFQRQIWKDLETFSRLRG